MRRHRTKGLPQPFWHLADRGFRRSLATDSHRQVDLTTLVSTVTASDCPILPNHEFPLLQTRGDSAPGLDVVFVCKVTVICVNDVLRLKQQAMGCRPMEFPRHVIPKAQRREVVLEIHVRVRNVSCHVLLPFNVRKRRAM